MHRDYRLSFNKRSKDGSGKANAEEDAGSSVWGVIYDISDSDLEILDRGEGAGYKRVVLPIHDPSGKIMAAWTYLAVAPESSRTLKPYTWYKAFLVAGAREHGLPRTYVDFLEAFEALEDSDAVRSGSKLKLLSASDAN